MSSEFDREVEHHYRFNAVANLLDGVCFWLSLSFIASRTILPLYVSHLTDSTFAIGLLSTLAAAGWFLPQLFTANWVERLPRKKVAAVHVGFFSERLPVLLMLPAALVAERHPTLALVSFFLCYGWHTIGGGLIAVGWQDMFAKVIPLDRRARLFGLTNFIGMGGGALAAVAAAWLLERHSFPDGYVLCFAAAALFTFLSWFFLALVREPALESPNSGTSQREYWRRLPAILRRDDNFRRYLLSQLVINASGMATGFLAVYAVQRWQLSDDRAGTYTISMLVGQSFSNLLFGALADRRGHKVVLELSALLGAFSVVVAMLAPNSAWFHAVFAFLGMSFAGFYQSGVMISMEFSTPEVRPTYIGMNNTVNGIAAALSPLLGAWLASALGYRWLFAVAFVIGLVGFALLRWSVREPRHVGQATMPTSSV